MLTLLTISLLHLYNKLLDNDYIDLIICYNFNRVILILIIISLQLSDDGTN